MVLPLYSLCNAKSLNKKCWSAIIVIVIVKLIFTHKNHNLLYSLYHTENNIQKNYTAENMKN